jgi:hypothetical protein
MLKKYKNELIRIIEDFGFDPRNFKPIEKNVDGEPAFILKLINSPMFFMVRTSNDNYHDLDVKYVEFGPNYSNSEYYPPSGWGNFDHVSQQFTLWLKNNVSEYLNEIDTPDLWSQINGDQLFQLDPNEENRSKYFDKVEKQKIEAALVKFTERIKIEFKPTSEQLETICAQLEYLKESTERLDKFDWQGIAISTIISISISLSLDNDDGKVLFQAFRDSFIFITGLIGN